MDYIRRHYSVPAKRGARVEYDEALVHLATFAELFPNDMRVYPRLAQAYRGAGDLEAAEGACERGLLIFSPSAPISSYTVTSARGGYVYVRFDGEKRPVPMHPTWNLEWL